MALLRNQWISRKGSFRESCTKVSLKIRTGLKRTLPVSIRGWRTQYTVQTFRGFVISSLFEDNSPAGSWQVGKGHDDARISPGCRRSGVSHANLRYKTSVHMMWKAPDVCESNIRNCNFCSGFDRMCHVPCISHRDQIRLVH